MGRQLLSAAKYRSIVWIWASSLEAVVNADVFFMLFLIVKLLSQLRSWQETFTKSYMETELQMRPLPVQRFFESKF